MAGVAHHTHIHISRTLANFFPRHIFNFWRILPQTHLWDERCIFFGVFHFSFLLAVPIIFQKKNIFSNILANPPHDPKTPWNLWAELPKIFCEIHPKFSYNHFCVIIWNPRRLIHTYLHPLQFCYTPVLAVLVALSNFHWNIWRYWPPLSITMCCSICFISHILKLFPCTPLDRSY